jgi:hypothetical protein
MNKPELTGDCHRAIFHVEKQELQDSSVDYTLLTTCKHMIRQFCHEEDKSQALVCLKVSEYSTPSVGRVWQGYLRSEMVPYFAAYSGTYTFRTEGFKIIHEKLFLLHIVL